MFTRAATFFCGVSIAKAGFTVVPSIISSPAWFKPASLSPVKSFFGQYDLIEVGIDTTTNQIELWTNLGGSISASSALVAGSWKHLAAVGDGTTLTLYVNGVQVATGGSATATYGNNTEDFKIGEGVMDSSGGYFDGTVDEVRVYNRPMCADEIQAMYESSRAQGMRILSWVELK